MKKLIFGLCVFFTSVLGILGSVGFEFLGRLIFSVSGDYPTGSMETCGACLFVFVITAAIGFVFALIGVFSRDKQQVRGSTNENQEK